MVLSATTRVAKDQKIDFANLNQEELDGAIDRFLNNKSGSEPSDQFLRKIRTVTSSMGHTGEAANMQGERFLLYY